MLYLYAFVRQWATVPVTTGIGGSRVLLVPLGTVAAVVGEVAGAIEPTDEHVLAHAQVVDALAAANDAVLPVRFGRGFRDADDLERAAGALGPALEERLESVCGCVEIGLHVVAPPASVSHADSGQGYMQRRLRELSRSEALADEIHEPLAERARAASRASGTGAGALLRASYLVERGDVVPFKALVANNQRRHPELSFACTGPWPPYSFAALEPAGAIS